MTKELEFFQNAGVWYLATADEDGARVRPMGGLFDIGGKLSFGTNDQKDMFKQMLAHPRIEICAVKDGEFLRISGEVAPNTTDETKARLWEMNPGVAKMYQGREAIFQVVSFEHASATWQDMKGKKETVALY